MARLRRESPVGRDSGDDIEASTTRTRTTNTTSRLRTSPRKKATAKSYVDSDIFQDDSESEIELSKLVVKVPTDSARAKRQIKLAPLKASESYSELRQKIASPESSRRRPLKDVSGNGKESGKPGLPLPRLNAFASRPSLKPSVVVDEDREEEAEIEESVWCGSDANSSGSEDELPSPRKLWPGKRMNATSAPKSASSSLDEALQGLQGLTIKEAKKDAPRQTIVPSKKAVVPEERPSSSHSHDADSLDAILHFSPPRLATRPRQRTPDRPVTPPPASPFKSRLVSPSKTRTRIPTPPMRQSLDAFWSPNEVNEWNDKHSPRKAIGSPKKNPFLPSSESTFPTSSPKKSSPTKRSSAEVQAKKDFAARKHALAESFLAELDDTITSGQIAALSASTGGVRILWSKTLNSTAGRANWRRETTRTRASPTAPATTTTQKHHASIELAEKVIDDEERLFNVLAHEFCHLANFMVSGIKDQPHGASFKAWGSKCTAAFASRGVHVTTKHSYQIDYKYVWRCSTEGCWAEFKRHSKSIDPLRHTCGSCKGKLLQIKPVPRGSAVPGGKVGGYAGFVKQHFADVKKSLPVGSSQKEVMEAVGRKYREEKERKAAEATTPKSGVDDLARALDVVVLDD
jgi:predicted SprT family Zn-dependent metalloprotease